MNRIVATLVVAGALGLASTAFAQSYPAVPPPGTPAPYPGNGPAADPGTPPALPALSPEQETNLERELSYYRREVDERVARGQINEQEAAKLLSWRRWQLARQIAGLTPPEPPRVVVQREYVAPPYYGYDPYYPRPYYAPGYYYGPRISLCAGGWGHHSFGSLCF